MRRRWGLLAIALGGLGCVVPEAPDLDACLHDFGATFALVGSFGIEGHYFIATTGQRHGADRARLPGVLHFDGTDWETLRIPVEPGNDDSAEAVWAAAPDDVFVRGRQNIWRLHGGAWKRVLKLPSRLGTASPAHEESLGALWGFGSSDVWAIGQGWSRACAECPEESSLVAHHFDGRRWGQQKLAGPPGTNVDQIWGAAPDDVWAIGQGLLLHFDGTSWISVRSSRDSTYGALTGAAPDDVWLATESLEHYDGIWKSVPLPGSSASINTVNTLLSSSIPTGKRVRALQELPNRELYVLAGEDGSEVLFSWNGMTFVDTGITLPPDPIDLGADGDTLLVGGSAGIYRLDKGALTLWRERNQFGPLAAAVAVGSTPPRVVAVNEGKLVAIGEGEWQTLASLDLGTAQLTALAASSDHDVWLAAGDVGVEPSTLLHWDGADLQRVDLPDTPAVHIDGVALAASGELWVAGTTRTSPSVKTGGIVVLARIAGAWRDESPALGQAGRVMLSAAGSAVWLATDGGRIAVRHGGQSWKRHDVSQPITGLYAAAPDLIYVLPRTLGLWRYSGGAFTAVYELRAKHLTRIVGVGPEDIWASESGAQWHLQSDRWTAFPSGALNLGLVTPLGGGRAVFGESDGPLLFDCARDSSK